jgi:hypothetical protein
MTDKRFPNFADFIARMTAVYDTLRDTSPIKKGGLVPGTAVTGTTGYIICFRYSPQVTGIVSQVNESIRQIVPALKYSEQNAHTTIKKIIW